MENEDKKENKLEPALSGNWKNTTFWNFYIAPELPENAITTAVTGLIIWEDKIVLVENHRGWELPGGHVEKDETVKEALLRELCEEAGLENPASIVMFGYNEIINPEMEKINKVNGKPYPKYAYNPYFILETKEEPKGCQDGTCENIGFFDIDSEEVNNSKSKDIILIGYEFYLKSKS